MKRIALAVALLLTAAACEHVTRPTEPGGSKGGQPEQGEVITLNVNAKETCSNPVYHGARVMATSQHAIVLADTANPQSGLDATFYQKIGDTFDALTWPTDTDNFGTPTDIDGNGKVLILFTRAVNELTPKDAGFVVGGFFYSRDLFPKTSSGSVQGCAGSNHAEMFYMLAPDPNGTINAHRRSAGYVDSASIATLGHEFEHLINASRRLYVNDASAFEVSWLDEGLAHVAEELNFYAASGLTPGMNITLHDLVSDAAVRAAVNEHQVNNLARYSNYLQAPEKNTPIAGNDSLATRGASWNFLRYAADRHGGDQRQFWFALVNSTTTGLDNLQNVLGTNPLGWLHDWSVSVYTDDAVPGVDAVFTEPSWDFRSVLPAINDSVFPLQVHALASAQPVQTTVHGGSAAYFRFGVAAGETAEIRTIPGSASVPTGACGGPAQPLAVGAAYQQDASGSADLCFSGASGGADYVMITFYRASSGDDSIPVAVTGTGIVGVSAPPTPDLLRPLHLFDSPFPRHASVGDGGWERALRERERRDLTPLLDRAAAPRPLFDQASAPNTLQLVVVRTR